MKLATLKNDSHDGELILVDGAGKWAVKADKIAPNFRWAVENWSETQSPLQQLSQRLNEQGESCPGAFALDSTQLHSPLPRTWGWLDGSAYIQHIILVRKARGAEPPATLRSIPLMYQGGSDTFLAPCDDIPLIDPEFGLDFEGEVGIITDFVPMGTKACDAHKYILFFLLINDVSLRGLIPGELAQGFGFLQSKPSSAFSPFALTPEELGDHFRDGRVHLPLLSQFNGEFFGRPNAGEMHFSFFQLIEHAARTRDLMAGTIIGSGTVSNEDPKVGSSCLAEKRMLEKINKGEISTEFMKEGDQIEIKMEDEKGHNLFGTISQKVRRVTLN